MKKLICILLTLLALTSISACSRGSTPATEQTSPVVLTERQKQILRDNDLPEDFSRLTISQQASITAIEQMLSYAEEKYGTEFTYAGYIPAGPIEKQQLLAYPASGFMSTDTFTITKTADGYEDDYLNVACRDMFGKYIADKISELFPDIECRVYPEITVISLSEIPEDPSSFDGHTGGRLTIFVNEETCSGDQIPALQSGIQTLLKGLSLDCSGRIDPLSPDKFPDLDKFNYTDYLSETFYPFQSPIR